MSAAPVEVLAPATLGASAVEGSEERHLREDLAQANELPVSRGRLGGSSEINEESWCSSFSLLCPEVQSATPSTPAEMKPRLIDVRDDVIEAPHGHPRAGERMVMNVYMHFVELEADVLLRRVREEIAEKDVDVELDALTVVASSADEPASSPIGSLGPRFTLKLGRPPLVATDRPYQL